MPQSQPRRYRIESLVMEALAPMVASALPATIITLRHVSLNNDFSVATVVYGTVGDDSGRAQETLDKQAWRYRRRLATSLNMRKTPQLVFMHDDKGLAADKMRAFLDSISGDA